MPDQEAVRRNALAMPEATEQPHFDRTSYRVRGKIFATVLGASSTVNLALPPEVAAAAIETDAESVAPITWGSVRGWVVVDLTKARPGLLEQLIPAAWSRVAPKRLQQRVVGAAGKAGSSP